MKISRAPQNFYTASTAAKKLGMSKTTFYEHVRKGKIKKVVPPGGTEGYYPKKDIEQMVKAKELFILQYASEPSTFRKASQDDLQSLHDLLVSLFGYTHATPYETLVAWYKQNPETYYILTQEGIVTGYVGFLYLHEETSKQILATTERGMPVPDASMVLPFLPGQPVHGLWVGLGVRPGLPETQARFHGRHLITGAVDVLENLARRNIPVHHLYATSQTSTGMKLSQDLGFKAITSSHDPLTRFDLNLETSTLPLLRQYQHIIRRSEREKQTFEDSVMALVEQPQKAMRSFTSHFQKATLNDLQLEFELDSALYGEQYTTPYLSRVARFQKNTLGNYILKHDGDPVGYICFYPVEQNTLQKVLSNELHRVPIEAILPFSQDAASAENGLALFIFQLSIKKGLPAEITKHAAQHLIAGTLRVFHNFGCDGIKIRAVFATSRTPRGIRLCRKIGMQQQPIPNDPGAWQFSLDVAESNSRLAKAYQLGYAEYKNAG